MAAASGNNFLLAISNNASPEVYTTIAGMRTTSMTKNNAPVDITTKDSSHIRQLLAGGGVQSISMACAGVFTDAAVEETLRGVGFANTQRNYKLTFPNGDYIIGPFMVTNYQRQGDTDDAEMFTCNLESAGNWTYTAA